MERIQLKLNSNEAYKIIFKETEDFVEIENRMIGHWRHGTKHHGIFKRNDGIFFEIEWRDSNKEMKFSDMNTEPILAKQVFPREKLITIYE